MSLFITLSIWIITGAICCQVAKYRGRNPFIWFFVGFILGLIGLIILYIMPKKDGVPSAEGSSCGGRRGDTSSELLVKSKDFCDLTYLWYYLDESDKQHGPMSFDALHRAWEARQITPSTYVWNSGMKDWKIIEDVPNLLTKMRKHL